MPLYRDEAIVLRTQKLGEADRIATLLTRGPRQDPRRREGRPPYVVPLRRPAGAVQPRRPATRHRPHPRRRHPGRLDRGVRRGHRRRLRPVHDRHRPPGDRRPPRRRGEGTRHPAAPAAGRRPPRPVHRRTRTRPGPRLLPAPLPRDLRLRPLVRRLRPLRRTRPPPSLQPRRRRHGLLHLPPPGLSHARPSHRHPPGRPPHRRLAHRPPSRPENPPRSHRPDLPPSSPTT